MQHKASTKKIATRNQKIKALAEEGYTQEEIAKAFKITQSVVSRIINNPHSDTFEARKVLNLNAYS